MASSTGQRGGYDVVFPLNFGLPASLPSNRAIARIAVEAAVNCERPIFCAPRGIFDFGGFHNVVEGDFPGYVSTVKQIAALAKIAIQKQWKNVLIVAAPPHLWRALRDVRAAGLCAGAELSVYEYPRAIWYSRRSEHRQTTSWFRWWFTWELPARIAIITYRSYYERRARR
jgi:hypothetical protein